MIFPRLSFSSSNKREHVSSADIKLLRASKLLDPIWYRQNYDDLRDHPIDAAYHYLRYGAEEGRNPGPEFDTNFYLENNPDVRASGMNPLIHFIQYGKSENRLGKGLKFDAEFYAALHHDELNASDLSPLEHYERIGKAKFYHFAFDEDWYRDEYPDIKDFPTSLKEHYLSVGQFEGRHPAFHYDWYLHEYSDIIARGANPYGHYVTDGRTEGRHAGFDRNFYLREYPDIANARVDPFLHYINHGRKEGRSPGFNRRWYLHQYRDVAEGGLDPYEHYVNAGKAEGRPLSLESFHKITEWGHLNTKSVLNSPWVLDGRPPTPDHAFSPKITVIVPNYNHEAYLDDRLQSIYMQTYGNFEVILLDDCSNDNSVRVLRRYADQFPSQTKLIVNEKNSGGVFHQWKKGIAHATGELIWIAESDDFCDLNFLSELVYFFRNNGVMLAFSRTDFVTGQEKRRIWSSEAYWSEVGFDLGMQPVVKPAHEIVHAAWGARNLVANVSSMIFRNPGRLAILDDAEWQTLRMCGDWIMYLSLIRGGLIGYSPRATNYYRQHHNNTSVTTHDKDQFYQEHEVVARYLANFFNVNDSVLQQHQDVLYRHWIMKRGENSRSEFENLFSLAKVKSERIKRKPNIAIATYALVTGGGETFPILLANLLHEHGFPVTLLNFEAEITNPGIRAIISPGIPIVDLHNSADCGAALARLGVELVHSHHALVDITLALSLKKHPQIRHVVTTHGLYEMLDKDYVQKYEHALLSVSAFVYIANKNLDGFSSKLKSKAFLTKITNTVGLGPLTGLTRKQVGLKSDDFVICLASRAVSDKGWQEAIDAVVLANKESRREIHLLLVGDGPETERLKNAKLPPYVHLVGFQKNVRDFFAISDIGLIASKFRGESCPLVLIECLSVGKPVVSSDIGDVTNMLSTSRGPAGETHSLANWEIDVPALGKSLRRIANDQKYYDDLIARVPEAMEKFAQDKVLGQYIAVYNDVLSGAIVPQANTCRISVILVAYNMAREVPRTIFTLRPENQGLDASDYEVILIDNGSKCSYDETELRKICPNLKFHRYESKAPSPVEALNYGLKIAKGEIICACIDAARMASPGLLRAGLAACEADERAVVGALSFHLGHEAQNASVLKGYNQTVEDELLKTVDWESDGYKLFGISSFDPSSRFGLYNMPAETNALFMRRKAWEKCGGFDVRFVGRGGGLVNLDIWRRVCEDQENVIVLLVGEGTFHQFHGGVATNAVVDAWGELHTEYVNIRGYEFKVPDRTPFLYGAINDGWLAFQKRI